MALYMALHTTLCVNLCLHYYMSNAMVPGATVPVGQEAPEAKNWELRKPRHKIGRICKMLSLLGQNPENSQNVVTSRTKSWGFTKCCHFWTNMLSYYVLLWLLLHLSLSLSLSIYIYIYIVTAIIVSRINELFVTWQWDYSNSINCATN